MSDKNPDELCASQGWTVTEIPNPFQGRSFLQFRHMNGRYAVIGLSPTADAETFARAERDLAACIRQSELLDEVMGHEMACAQVETGSPKWIAACEALLATLRRVDE